MPKSTEALRTIMYCLQECHGDPAADVKGRYVSAPIVHCDLGKPSKTPTLTVHASPSIAWGFAAGATVKVSLAD